MRAEQAQLTRFRNDVPDHAAFVCAVCNRGMQVHWQGSGAILNRPEGIVAESKCIVKGAFVRWALYLLLVCMREGNADMCRQSGLLISREQGMCYNVDFKVPVFTS